MANEKERFFKLKEMLNPIIGMMGQASDKVVDEGISTYPIFVIHQQEAFGVGIELIRKQDGNKEYGVNISTLEEFVAKQLIESARVDNFRQVFKNPAQHLCLFVIDEIGATFVFIPRN